MAKSNKIKRGFTQTEYTVEQLVELKKCMDDPVYFINTYVKILHPRLGKIPFKLHDYQQELVRSYKDNRFTISKISRQAGKTETTCAYIAWFALFNDDKTILVAAQKLSNAKEIIDRVTSIYEELPDWIKPGINDTEWNKTSIAFENGSKIISQATSKGTGRGYSISLLYLDELAHVPPHVQDEMWGSIFPVLSTGGSCIISSTPNGDNELFAQLWRGAELQIGDGAMFHPISVDWDRVPGRDEKFKQEQIAMIGERKWEQEYECQFITSEHTLIDGKILAQMEKMVRLETTEIKGANFNQPFWKLPHRNGTYIVGVDPSEGVGNDYSVIQVFEFPSMEQIAEHRTNSDSPAVLYSYLKTLLQFLEFNSKEVYYSTENNGVGQAIIALIEADLNPLQKAFFVSENGDKPGFNSSTITKMRALIQFKEMVETNSLRINSMTTIKELKSLVRKDKTFKARIGATDDCVFAILICIRIMETMAEYNLYAYNKLHSFKNVKVDDWEKENDWGKEPWIEPLWEKDGFLPVSFG